MMLAKFITERAQRNESAITPYLPCAGCFAHCSMEGTAGEPCWGRVLYVPNYEAHRLHFCTGHESHEYRPKP